MLSSLAAPFLRHIRTMASLRFTLLVATLLGLALLANSRDAVAATVPRAAFNAPIPGGAAFLQCLQNYYARVNDGRPCFECAVHCLEAKRQNPVFDSACAAFDFCRRALA